MTWYRHKNGLATNGTKQKTQICGCETTAVRYLTKKPKPYTGKTAPSANDAGKRISICRRINSDLCLSLCIKPNFKWMKSLSMKPGIVKLLEENIGSSLRDVSVGKDFLSKIPFSQELWPTMDKWDLMKPKCFCAANATTE